MARSTPSIARQHGVYIVTDVRGFTSWYNRGGEAEEAVVQVLPALWQELRAAFPGSRMKPTGDGGFVTLTLDAASFDGDAKSFLEGMWRVTESFDAECARISREFGDSIELRLGWGIARGTGWFFRTEKDYVSRHINKAFRLCDLARPAGSVFDAYDFPSTNFKRLGFREATAELTGFGHCRVWLSSDVSS